jgi:hypothetical protein
MLDLPGVRIVTSDGKRFLVHGTATPNSSPPLTVVLNWNAGLRK